MPRTPRPRREGTGLRGGQEVERRAAFTEAHGSLTEAYIEYNRQDVRLTWDLYGALLAEWARHRIELAPEQAYSPASTGGNFGASYLLSLLPP